MQNDLTQTQKILAGVWYQCGFAVGCSFGEVERILPFRIHVFNEIFLKRRLGVI